MTILCAILVIIVMMFLLRTCYVNGFANGVKAFRESAEKTLKEMEEDRKQINFYMEVVRLDKEKKEKGL